MVIAKNNKIVAVDGKGLTFDSLIAEANAVTGAGDKTLAGAVGTLIDGYGMNNGKVYTGTFIPTSDVMHVNIYYPSGADPDRIIMVSAYCEELDETPSPTIVIGFICVPESFTFTTHITGHECNRMQYQTALDTSSRGIEGGATNATFYSDCLYYDARNRYFIAGKTYQYKIYEWGTSPNVL